MSEEEKIRCFVALEMPEALKQLLVELTGELKKLDKEKLARWVNPGGIHLTLKFLGDVPTEKLAEINSAVATANSQPAIKPFELIVTGIGMFPQPEAPRVVWVGLEGNLTTLAKLQKAVEKAVEPLGFLPEARGFTAHITLGYVKDAGREEKKRLGQAIKSYSGNLNFGSYIFTESAMMKSELTPTGAIYTPLQHFRFGGK